MTMKSHTCNPVAQWTLRAAALLALLTLSAPALAQAATSTTPIPGVPRWKLVQAADGCWAETGSGLVFAEGDTVHAKILINNSGDLILTASRPDWKRTETQIDFTVQADGTAPMFMNGSAAIVMVMASVKNVGDVGRLRGASLLMWNLPWGNYRAHVEGFAKAMDTVVACQNKQRAAPRPAR
jgi:hypothetical protein